MLIMSHPEQTSSANSLRVTYITALHQRSSSLC